MIWEKDTGSQEKGERAVTLKKRNAEDPAIYQEYTATNQLAAGTAVASTPEQILPPKQGLRTKPGEVKSGDYSDDD